MKLILDGYRAGTEFNIHMQEDGLIYAGVPGKALTWMDAVVFGKPVTPRIGLAVEINALWFNAIMFAMEMAAIAGDDDFVEEWSEIAAKIPPAFIDTFWNEEKGYLADYVDGEYKDWAVRPNMVFATSLPYSPIDELSRKRILSRIKQELLTPERAEDTHPDECGL